MNIVVNMPDCPGAHGTKMAMQQILACFSSCTRLSWNSNYRTLIWFPPWLFAPSENSSSRGHSRQPPLNVEHDLQESPFTFHCHSQSFASLINQFLNQPTKLRLDRHWQFWSLNISLLLIFYPSFINKCSFFFLLFLPGSFTKSSHRTNCFFVLFYYNNPPTETSQHPKARMGT